MPIILVVDDSETDRMLIGGLLKPKLDWIVQYATNGAEGLQMIDDLYPDVVITDLQMPEMNGIELCAAAKQKHAHVPIILVTGRGSEDLAAEALRAGASSYVPKSGLSNYLLDTVEQIVSLAKHNKSKVRLLQEQATGIRVKFSLEADQNFIAPLVDYVMTNMGAMVIGDEAQRRQVAVALEESLLNAMYHGNMELGADTAQAARKLLHDGNCLEEVSKRCAVSPYKDRRVLLAVNITRKNVEIIVRDEGAGFDTQSMAKFANDPSQLSDASGRGLTLIHNFMDEVSFNDSGCEIHMKLAVAAKATDSATADAGLN